MGRILRSAIWAALTSTSTPIRLEYVNTTLNPWGYPSRNCELLPEELRHVRNDTECDAPRISREILGSLAKLTAAQFGNLPQVEGRSSKWKCQEGARALIAVTNR